MATDLARMGDHVLFDGLDPANHHRDLAGIAGNHALDLASLQADVIFERTEANRVTPYPESIVLSAMDFASETWQRQQKNRLLLKRSQGKSRSPHDDSPRGQPRLH